MNVWGKKSYKEYLGCHPDLQWLLDELLQDVDISIIQGHRGKEEQNYYFDIGTSKVRWPYGSHNSNPSRAVDIQPHPRPSSEINMAPALGYIAGRAVEIGKKRNLEVIWGGDWNHNGDLTDQSFDDLFHLEI